VFLAGVVYLPKAGFVRPGGLTSAADRAKAESDFRGHLLQAIGGIVLAAGAYFTGRTFALNREGQHTERFTRAIEQLADSEKLDVRLGGIYALDRIAHDSRTYYQPVMEVLTAFLRENAHWRKSLSASERKLRPLGDRPELRYDLQAAVTVVAKRDRSTPERKAFRPNLFGADLAGAFLVDAQLQGANLRYVDLSDAVLIGANLYEAQFGGGSFARARFDRANLGRTLLTTSTDFSGAKFVRADLTDAMIPGTLDGVDLSSANLTRAHLDRTTLSLTDLSGADLSGASLAGADLSTAVSLTSEQLRVAITDEDTKLPPSVA
jgi:hypothetical protein